MSTSLWQALWFSLQIAVLATLGAAIVAIPLAFLMARRRFIGKSVVEALLLMPMVLPPTVVGYFIIVALGSKGWLSWLLPGYSIVLKFEGAVLAAAVVALPMLYLPAKAGFASVDRELEDVATLMGATRWQMFWQVSVPLAARGLASGLVLAFARAMGEFGATLMVFGIQPKKVTLPITIWVAWTADDRDLSAATWSVVALSAMSFGLILLYNRSSASRQEGAK